MKKITISFILFTVIGLTTLSAQATVSDSIPDKLVVVWTSGDPEVAETMVLMYTNVAKTNHWFKDVTLVIWGPSARLVVENPKIQEKVKKMQKDGVVLEACVACANMLGVTDELKKLGVDVRGMGTQLTAYLKSGAKVLTF